MADSQTRSDFVAVRRANYIIRHWRGDLSLPISFWINLCLLSFGYGLAAGVFFEYPSLWSRNYIAYCILTYSLVILGLGMPLWQLVGVWRSAKKHMDRGGWRLWARTAQVAVIGNWAYWAICNRLVAFLTVCYFIRPLFRNLRPRLGRGPGEATEMRPGEEPT